MEFDLIERIRQRCPAQRGDTLLGIGDDAALLASRPRSQLVAATDTLVSGVHFLADDDPADTGWKALAVNLSDLAAMGAEPAWALLNLTLPHADSDFVDQLIEGFAELAAQHQVDLVGGDTTRGPLSITVTALGWCGDGALNRDRARAGDLIAVSGTIGDAGYAYTRPDAADPQLRRRLCRPQPRLSLGRALRGIAHAAIDISDGVLADLDHLLRPCRFGAELDLAQLPTSAALAAQLADEEQRWQLQLSAGDDYELLFTVPADCQEPVMQAAKDSATPVTIIGRVTESPEVRLLRPDGSLMSLKERGYVHFTTN
ncbi:MAG: thiamine-phosphate kinase [Wenzhouxiangellaceae bacterium]